jgi:sporadic carbohydrate cluster 2OG-Fe(II) oxygenase
MGHSQSHLQPGFLDQREIELGERFLQHGYLIEPVAERDGLDRLRAAIADGVAETLSCERPTDPGKFLNEIHLLVDPVDLNSARLAAINTVNNLPWARRLYYEMAKPWLEIIVGNELAMQRRLNLSIQLPGDTSSLLAAHADSWDGDSPFEVVVWLPLVDCYDTKSMFLLPPDKAQAVQASFSRFDGADTDDLFAAIEQDLIWVEVPYGHVLLFNQNLLHGNRPNRESETRWTMNCRFKSLFSPYAGKRLGEFFEPITLRAATRVGMTHSFPDGFDE